MNAIHAVPPLDLESCRALLHDPAFDVVDLGAYFAEVEAASGVPLPNIRAQIARLLFFVRGDAHVELRRAALGFFRPAVITGWQPVIAACADTEAARLPAGGTADLVARFAAPICSQSICRILGLQADRSAEFDLWTEEARWLTEPMLPLRRLRAIEAALGHFAAAIAEAMAAPPPAEAEGRPTFLHHANPGLADEDRLWMAIILHAAGQSTLHTLANILLRLARLPAGQRAPLGDPIRRMRAVDRLIAADGSIQFISRVTGRGERIDLPLAAVNRESLGGRCPLDLDAPPAPAHLAFGAGPHKCVGGLVARLIIADSLTSLVRRFPTFALAREPRSFQRSTVIASPCDLLCTLD
jgi:cytochrome P450